MTHATSRSISEPLLEHCKLSPPSVIIVQEEERVPQNLVDTRETSEYIPNKPNPLKHLPRRANQSAVRVLYCACKKAKEPANMAGFFGAGSRPVEHAAKDFGGHDHDLGVGVDGDVSSHQAHVVELLLQLPKLLIAQRLEGSTSLLTAP